ncbi:MAG TPA: hypothetical protein VK153_01855 [Candidatus Paceibacterota bacterium]|nr:hypothetical protein [Candidatus Paceibacterota bacterium]
MEHKEEKRICQNCKNEFTIEPEDFNFYEKIKVPAPTWCPECRLIRRLSFNNVFSIYKRNCGKCNESIISMYSPDKKTIVYCNPCWWADSWDGREYAMDYNPSRPFFEQLKELTEKTPYQATNSGYKTLINCKYNNGLGYCKDCYMIFWADYCENVFYSAILNTLKHSSDCIRGYFSELCYESVGFSRCYRTFFSDECDDCIDVWFSRNCYNCTNCIGCVNLRGESNCIFNVKYTKDEYKEKLKELNLESWKSIHNLEKEAHKFWLTKPFRAYHGHSLNLNVTGDYVYESKNSKEGYILNGAEDCKWCQFITVKSIKDCYDYSGWGNGAELIYEVSVAGEGASNVRFSDQCWPNVMNVEYSIYANSCKNCFGCVNLKNKEYCILNKQYTKEEYEKLKQIIIENIKRNPYIDKRGRTWTYGEFLPLELSPFAYNETLAIQFFPKTKEEILEKGFDWYEKKDNQYTITMKAENLPDTLSETDDSVLDEIISCATCGKAYKFVSEELNLMRKLGMPLPHSCFNCRQQLRFSHTNLPKLYNRNCDKCGIKVRTSYAPDRPEVIYCENCYQQEFI